MTAELAALAVKQARGDLIEAIFLLRAYRTTLPRFGTSRPSTRAPWRCAADLGHLQGPAGGQILGPTFDYTHRLLDFDLAERAAGEPTAGRAARADGADRRGAAAARRGAARPRGPDRDARSPTPRTPGGDLTREPLDFPAERDVRLQNLARGDEGFLLAIGYATQRGYGRNHPFAGEIRQGEVAVELVPEELGFAVEIAEITVTECQMVNQFKGSATAPPQFTRGYGLVFGDAERKAMAMALVDRALRGRELGEEVGVARPGRGVRAQPLRQRRGVGLRAAPQASALRGLPVGAGAGPDLRAEAGARSARERYNFAFLDEQTKRMIRRADPQGGGHSRLPGAVRQPRDAALLRLGHGRRPGHRQRHRARRRPQGHRPGRRRHHQRGEHPPVLRAHHRRATTTTRTDEATLIQTRHRIPETPLRPGRSWCSRCRSRSRCAGWSRARSRRGTMHALEEYGVMYVRLYEDITRHGQVAQTYDYPVIVNGRYLMRPSPIPKFDNPKLDRCPALLLFGAGREKRIYAVPPYTRGEEPRLRGPPVRGGALGPAVRPLRRHAACSSTR